MKKFILYLLFAQFSFACNNSHATNPILQPERELLGSTNNLKLKEISGMAISRKYDGIIWVHNDSGDDAHFFAINYKGEIVAECIMKNATNIDWEDIAIGPGPVDGTDYIYIADTGDNLLIRNDYAVYRIAEPVIDPLKLDQKIILSNFDKIELSYPDISHDCETIFIEPSSKNLFFITKRDSFALAYRLNNPPIEDAINTLELIGTMQIGKARTKRETSRICGGDMSADGKNLIIKSYDSVYYFSIDNDLKEVLIKKPSTLYYVAEAQGEAIAFDKESKFYFTISEAGPLNVDQGVFRYNFIKPFVPKIEDEVK